MGSPKRAATTVYLDPRIARAAKVKAALVDRSLSDLVNEALAHGLREDEADLRALRDREKEPERAFEDVLRDLKRDGLL